MSFLKRIGESIERLDQMLEDAKKVLSGEEIEETDEGYIIKVNLPDVKKEDVDVCIEKRILKVRVPAGKVRVPAGRAPCFYPFFPSHIGNLRNIRDIHIPIDADMNTVTAKFDAGVLTVGLKKIESARKRRIVVE